MLGGCLTGEEDAGLEGDGVVEIALTEVKLSGSVGTGPIVGANMVVAAIDGEQLARFQSDTNAGYDVSISAVESYYPLTISASGGTNLVTGLAPDFNLLSAVLGGNENSVVNVNPFSTIAVELAHMLPGGMTVANLNSAEEIVSRELNSGLAQLAATGPIGSVIDASNIAEMIRASQTLSEIMRRTRVLLQGAGFDTRGDKVVLNLAADLTDAVVDGLGASNADGRTAAVSTIASAQVLLESMANELHVNGTDATDAMRSAIDQVTDGAVGESIYQLGVTAEMIAKARIGLAAAFAINPDPAIRQFHAIVSGISPGQNSLMLRIVFPSDYRDVLQSTLALIPSADAATIGIVNAIARSNGDIDSGNLPPVIQGTPGSSISVGATYRFAPDAVDPDGDRLAFDVVNLPPWATFDAATGALSGSPQSSDVGEYTNITIRVSDGEFTVGLPDFSVVVTDANTTPQISGIAPDTISPGNFYSFTPTATDAENDTLTFSITGLPSWASFRSSTGQVFGAPNSNDTGTYSGISITVTDGQASDSLAPFTVTVTESDTNSAPQISGAAPDSVASGQSYSFTPSASDPDRDSLSFSVSGLPSWAAFDTQSGRLSGTPTSADVGTYTAITITVTDGQASDSLAPFTITVQAVSLGSVTLSWTAPTENSDGSTLTNLAGYKLYWGTTSGQYPNSVTINNASVTTYVIENLSTGSYEFVATAFNLAGIESSYSAPVTKLVQ